MCGIAAVLPWLTGAAAVATTVQALKPTPSMSIDMPEAPKITAASPAPTVQDVNPTADTVSTSAQAKQKQRLIAAQQQSWLSTNLTGGQVGTANTKKTLLGGIATPLGAGA